MSTKVPATTGSQSGTRERLLRAAAEVFREQGYEGTRVGEVARRAGLTTGAIYANFRGKSELLQEVVASGSAELVEQIAAERRAGASHRDILEFLGRRIARPAVHGPDRRLLIEAFAAARRDPEVAEAMRRNLDQGAHRLARTVERAQEEGSIVGDVSVDAVVRFAQALAFGLYLLESMDTPMPSADDWDALISRVVGSLAT